MKWELLQESKCPYCENALAKEEKEYACTSCRFVIAHDRFTKIVENRRPGGEGIKLRWQNLREEKCPICGNELAKPRGIGESRRCLAQGCTFRIRTDRMKEILSDETHPANRFYRPNLINELKKA